jgi:hypothetical protein
MDAKKMARITKLRGVKSFILVEFAIEIFV